MDQKRRFLLRIILIKSGWVVRLINKKLFPFLKYMKKQKLHHSNIARKRNSASTSSSKILLPNERGKFKKHIRRNWVSAQNSSFSTKNNVFKNFVHRNIQKSTGNLSNNPSEEVEFTFRQKPKMVNESKSLYHRFKKSLKKKEIEYKSSLAK